MTLRIKDGFGGLAGLQHCGSVWSCPVCSARIRVHRALEIGSVLGRAVAAGHPLAFCTFTMAHHAGQTLDELWAAAQQAWRRTQQGKAAQKDKKTVVGSVRVWEVTWGANGWHVHVHFVMVLQPGTTAAGLDEVAGGMYRRWSAGLTAAGLDAPQLVGQDWHLVEGDAAAEDLGGYLAKLADTEPDTAGLGLELTHSLPGRSAAGHATVAPFALLGHLAATGETQALNLWHEWERVSKGKRQIGWSAGLRQLFGPEVEELTDDEVVSAEVGTAFDDVCRWDAVQWREFVAAPARIVALLDAADTGGAAAAVALLDEWGVNYQLIGDKGHGNEKRSNGQGRTTAGSGGQGAELSRPGQSGTGDAGAVRRCDLPTSNEARHATGRVPLRRN